MLWVYQRVFFGKLTNPSNQSVTDIGFREKFLIFPILLMMFWIGIYSSPFLRRMEASLQLVQQRIDDARGPGGIYHVERRTLKASHNGLR